MTIVRRLAIIGSAVLLAAVPMIGVPMIGVPVIRVAAPAHATTTLHHAATPHYVAIVISGRASHCVRWKPGITGDTVLNDVASVAYRSDGLIVQIDGAPTSGTADATHFWSYWHDTSGTWSYSNSGASGYTPKAGTVEGWSYDNGSSSPPKPAQSPARLYATLCGAKDAAVSTPVTHRSARPSTQASASRSVPRSGRSSAHRPPSHAPSPSVTASVPTAARHPVPAHRHQHSASGSSASSPPARPTPRTSSPGGTARQQTARIRRSSSATDASSRPTSGTPTGLIVGLVLVVLLAAGGAVAALRRRGA